MVITHRCRNSQTDFTIEVWYICPRQGLRPNKSFKLFIDALVNLDWSGKLYIAIHPVLVFPSL